MSLFNRLAILAVPMFLVACSSTSSGSSSGETGGSGGSGASGGGETGGSGGTGGQAPTCPSSDDPAVHYISQDPSQCDQTDCGGGETDCIPCSGDQEYFSNPECGCGCIDPTTPLPTCPDPEDPAVHYLETDPALCGLTDCGEADCIPCDPEQEYFENECGCGCIDPAT